MGLNPCERLLTSTNRGTLSGKVAVFHSPAAMRTIYENPTADQFNALFPDMDLPPVYLGPPLAIHLSPLF